MEPGFALFSPNFLAVSHNGPIYSIKYSGLCVYYRGMCQLTELLAAVTVGHSCAGGQTPASAAQDCEAASSTLGPSPCWGVQIVQGCFLPWCQSLRCRTRSWIAQDLAQEICSVWRNWPYLEHWLNSPCKSCGMRGLKAAPGSVVYCRSSWLHLFPHNFVLFIFFFALSTWLTELATLTWSGDLWSLRTFAESQQSQTKLWKESLAGGFENAAKDMGLSNNSHG